MPTILLSGSQIAVINTKHYLISENTTNGTFVLQLNAQPVVNGDIIEIEILSRSSSTGPSQRAYYATYSHAQSSPVKYSVPVPSGFRYTATILQLQSITGKTFDWVLYNYG